MDRIILDDLFLVEFFNLAAIDNLSLSREIIFLYNFLKTLDYYVFDSCLTCKDILEVFYLCGKLARLRYALENILLIDIAKLYFCDVFRLNFVYSEAYHKIRDNFALFLGFADNRDCAVNIKKNLFETL